MSTIPLEWLILIAGGGLIACGASTMVEIGRFRRSAAAIHARMAGVRDDEPSAGKRGSIDIWLAHLGKHLVGEPARQLELARDLSAAGYYHQAAPFHFAAVRFLCTALFVIAGTAMLVAGSAPLPGLGAIGVGAALYLTSGFLLQAMRRRHERRVLQEFPFFLDILVMMLRSGASLNQIFRQIAQTDGRAIPLIHAATLAVVEQLERGHSYEEVLQRWAIRLGAEPAQELAGMFEQSIVMGTELSGALREFAKIFIAGRLLIAQERGGRRLVQLTVIALVFLLPPLLALLLAPAGQALYQALVVGPGA